MNKIRSKLPVVLLILAAPMLNSCSGGGDGSVGTIIEDFIPVFVNQWQGVDSDFMLHEFQFDVVTPGSSSGEFNQADSSVQVSDKFGNSQPSLEFRGSYDQQNFDFETIDSNGNVVGSFSARISNDNQFIDITPINPAAPRFRIYLLEDGVSPIPDVEGAWGDAVSSMVFELNPGTSDQDFSAFFMGSDQSQTDVVAVEGWYVSENILIRTPLSGQSTDLAGTFSGADTINLNGGRSLARGGNTTSAVVAGVKVNSTGLTSVYVTDVFDSTFAMATNSDDDLTKEFPQGAWPDYWTIDPTGQFVGYWSFVPPNGDMHLIVSDISDPGSPIRIDLTPSLSFASSPRPEIKFSPDGRLVAWVGQASPDLNRSIYMVESAVAGTVVKVAESAAIDVLDLEWAHDSSSLAYYGAQDGGTSFVNTASVAGGQAQVFQVQTAGFSSISWSPSSNFIAVGSEDDRQQWIVPPAGGILVNANRNPNHTTKELVWLDDTTVGQDIYIYESVSGGVSNIYLADASNAAGGTQQFSFHAQNGIRSLKASPGGTRVAYIYEAAGATQRELWVFDASAGETTLATGTELGFAFAPDDSAVFYARRVQGAADVDALVMNFNSAAPNSVLVPQQNERGAISDIQWAPNSDSVTFRKIIGTTGSRSLLAITQVQSAGVGDVQSFPLTDLPLSDTDIERVRWTRDGLRVVYNTGANRGGRRDAFSVARNGFGTLKLFDAQTDGTLDEVDRVDVAR